MKKVCSKSDLDTEWRVSENSKVIIQINCRLPFMRGVQTRQHYTGPESL